ncbi:hypothetical protein PR202_gb24748 [Eleusine coracana subsp. coracana]|uniref:Uncharacterized protein n=1 Tax=Eleusine coracana subsp. coracana TaxID=191504 RepID=A0AAV5FMC2_ELECO|nr:hypothetical protein QOZ80_5BG0451830 [Eleusine coracana subsp. coracana]GJN35932.1 hypothetical protein PR202_gb24748 [Eleusine coracana subsp. coracana]
MAASCKKEEREAGLLVKQQGMSKLHAKMLSKEAAAQLAVPSFRVYYSVASAGAVPFLWESQPGTPKNDSSSAAALTPPLTPPPSYYAAAANKAGDGGGAGGWARRRRRGIFTFLRLRSSAGRTATTPPPQCSLSSASWSTSSSSSSTMSPVFAVQSSSPSPAAPVAGRHRRTFSAGEDDECFGMEHECCERGIVKGCSVVGAVRSALATVVSAGRRA